MKIYILESCIDNDEYHKFDTWYILAVREGNIVYAAKTICVSCIETTLERLELEEKNLKSGFPFGLIGVRNIIEEAFLDANIFASSYMDARFKILHKLILAYKQWFMLSL